MCVCVPNRLDDPLLTPATPFVGDRWGDFGTSYEKVHFKTAIAKSYYLLESAVTNRYPDLYRVCLLVLPLCSLPVSLLCFDCLRGDDLRMIPVSVAPHSVLTRSLSWRRSARTKLCAPTLTCWPPASRRHLTAPCAPFMSTPTRFARLVVARLLGPGYC